MQKFTQHVPTYAKPFIQSNDREFMTMIFYILVIPIQVYKSDNTLFSVEEACKMLVEEIEKAKTEHGNAFFKVNIIFSPFKGDFNQKTAEGFTNFRKSVVGVDAVGFEGEYPLSKYGVYVDNNFEAVDFALQAGEISHAAPDKESLVSEICAHFCNGLLQHYFYCAQF